MAETVVVTGASGFIAKHVLAELLKRGYAVRGTLRDPEKSAAVIKAVEAAGASSASLSFARADLTSDAGWDDALRDAAFVLHTASPFPIEQPDNDDALVKPAVEGTVRVLEAARRNAIRRVVLTSSTVAVMYPSGQRDAQHVFDEEDFSDATADGLTPYIRSKTLAEKAAWNFVAGTPAASELAVINPGFVQGPALDGDLSTSHELFRLMARGIYPAAPRIGFPVCDVRDVAVAHAEAMTNPKAAGQRFVIAEGDTSLFALGKALARGCPDLSGKVPKFELPDFAVRAAAVFDKRLRTILPELGVQKKCSAAKAKAVLGLTLRDADTAIGDAIASLRGLELI